MFVSKSFFVYFVCVLFDLTLRYWNESFFYEFVKFHVLKRGFTCVYQIV